MVGYFDKAWKDGYLLFLCQDQIKGLEFALKNAREAEAPSSRQVVFRGQKSRNTTFPSERRGHLSRDILTCCVFLLEGIFPNSPVFVFSNVQFTCPSLMNVAA